MDAGATGTFRKIDNVLASLVPHELFARTLITPFAVKFALKLTFIVEVFCPLLITAPAGATQL